jgi:rare lipoprotein A (peptidoglycan hydrolase)
LLHNGADHTSLWSASAQHRAVPRALPAGRLDDVVLPSHLVAYSAPVTPTTVAPVHESVAPVTTDVPVAPVAPPAVTPTTVVIESHAIVVNNSERGQATWYSEAPPGKCASPTLPFGTVLTVTNDATGASTVCTVDDREADGYPRVVDMSYSGFSQIADPSQGVVDVTISW